MYTNRIHIPLLSIVVVYLFLYIVVKVITNNVEVVFIENSDRCLIIGNNVNGSGTPESNSQYFFIVHFTVYNASHLS